MGRKHVNNSVRQRATVSVNTKTVTSSPVISDSPSTPVASGNSGSSDEEDSVVTDESEDHVQPVALSFIIFISIILYWNALDCGFVFDDMSAIKDNKDLRSEVPLSNLVWNDFWGTPMASERSHKSYRPLTVFTFRLNYALGELSAWGYHLVNVILHCVVSVMFYIYCLKLNAGHRAATIAGLLFAVHPIHTEAVTGVVGRAELLASVFFLAALLLYRRCSPLDGMKSRDWMWLLVVVILVGLGTLCKEQCITVIGVCCVHEALLVQKLSLFKIRRLFKFLWLAAVGGSAGVATMSRTHVGVGAAMLGRLRLTVFRCIVLVGATCLLLYVRIQVMGAQLPVFTAFDNPAAHSPTPQRQLTYNYLLPVNLLLLIFPYHLCCDWTMGTLEVISGWSDHRNLITLVFWTGFIILSSFVLVKRTRFARLLGMAIALLALPFLPASNLFFPVGFVVAERVLYTPSMGFCLFVGLSADRLLRRSVLRHALGFFLITILLLMSLKTWSRNYDWRSEYTLFTSALTVNTRNAKLWNNVGHALESEQRWEDALGYFQQAARVQPDDIGAHVNVGRTLVTLNRTVEAEQAYRTALALLPQVKPGTAYTTRIAPGHLKVFINLSNLLVKNGTRSRLVEADNYLRRAISMRADFVEAYQNRADVLIRLNRRQEAVQHYRMALQYEPQNADLLFNLGVVELGDGHKQQAFEWFEKSLAARPDHKQALYNSAILLSESADPTHKSVSGNRFRKLAELGFDPGSVNFNLAMLETDAKRFQMAERHYLEALKHEPAMRAALFNLALMYNTELQNPASAVQTLKRLLKFHPDHAKGHLLMGDLMINWAKKPVAAKGHFLRATELEPTSAQAKHNLCVAMVEAGELLPAETCLLQALKLAKPGEEYISKSLEIVREKMREAKLRAGSGGG